MVSAGHNYQSAVSHFCQSRGWPEPETVGQKMSQPLSSLVVFNSHQMRKLQLLLQKGSARRPLLGSWIRYHLDLETSQLRVLIIFT